MGDHVETAPSPGELMTESAQIVIVGAGIGGLATAIGLARRGVRPLVLDKARFPREKVCGGCLNSRSVASLHALGAGDLLDAAGAVYVKHMCMTNMQRRTVTLPLSTAGGHPPRAISRGLLDELLLARAIGLGVEVRQGAQVLATTLSGDRRILRIRRGDNEAEVEAECVIAADGLASILGQSIDRAEVAANARFGAGALLDHGSFPGLDPATITMACAPTGYCGVVGDADGGWIVAAALDGPATRHQGGPARHIASILHGTGVGCQARCPVEKLDASLLTTPPLTRRRNRVADERLLLVGDASGYLEPITGEGMAWALAGAKVAVDLVAESPWRDGHAAAYEHAWRACIGNRRLVRLASRALRSPRVTSLAIGAMRLAPPVARFAARTAATGRPAGSPTP